MQSIEIEAKTVEEAISIACEKFQVPKDKIAVEILQDGPGKIMGLLSGKKAKIKATLVEDDNKDAIENRMHNILETIVKKIYSNASVQIKRQGDKIVFNICGDGSGIFIGKRGQTLDALQYIINKIKTKHFKQPCQIIVDSESYRSRRTQSLVDLAKQLSEKAKRRRGPVTTNPLNPAERKVIHMTVKNDATLTTRSKGEGLLKKVVITPKQS